MGRAQFGEMFICFPINVKISLKGIQNTCLMVGCHLIYFLCFYEFPLETAAFQKTWINPGTSYVILDLLYVHRYLLLTF